MKERPILFSAPMVRALLAGTKTQTRRAAKQRGIELSDADVGWSPKHPTGPTWAAWWPEYPCEGSFPLTCPYGQPGDRLWVREAWRVGAWNDDEGQICIDYRDGPRKEWVEVGPNDPDGEMFNRLWGQSTDDAIKVFGDKDRYEWEPGHSPCRWRPSIHMPRWASRITLEVTGVRVERLQGISEADSIAEGLTCKNGLYATPGEVWQIDPRKAYRDLWEQLNGPGSWAANPWVWAIEFKRLP